MSAINNDVIFNDGLTVSDVLEDGFPLNEGLTDGTDFFSDEHAKKVKNQTMLSEALRQKKLRKEGRK